MNGPQVEQPHPEQTARSLVVVVDDDKAMREALSSLFRSVDLDVLLFASPAEMLQASLPDLPACVVLDVRLPGLNGLDVHRELTRLGVEHPVVFMTGHGDIPMTVRAMKAGAVDFLSKPFDNKDMLRAVRAAIERDVGRRAEVRAHVELKERYEKLTPRERQVMEHVVSGLLNKQIAGVIGLSEITVKIHRGNVMRKMAVKSVAALVRCAEALLRNGTAGKAPDAVDRRQTT